MTILGKAELLAGFMFFGALLMESYIENASTGDLITIAFVAVIAFVVIVIGWACFSGSSKLNRNDSDWDEEL